MHRCQAFTFALAGLFLWLVILTSKFTLMHLVCSF